MSWSVDLLFFTATLFISLHLSSAYKFIKTFSDKIHAGEVKYYTLESSSPVILALISTEGDADLYGSPTNKNNKPSADSFDYMSASCGLDVMVLPMNEGVRRVSVGIYGHMRHENTSYQVWVVEPDREDVLRYQVWEIDPETMTNKLVIDMDPLVLANDPALHTLLETVYTEEGGIVNLQSGASDVIKNALQWAGYLSLKLLEIGLEILT